MTATLSPARREQAMRALAKGDGYRLARAALKRDIAAGRRSIRRVLIEPPDYLVGMRVAELIAALPHYGDMAIARVLGEARVPRESRLGRISLEQRLTIVLAIEQLNRSRDAARGYRRRVQAAGFDDLITELQEAILRRAVRLGQVDRASTVAALSVKPSSLTRSCTALRSLSLLDEFDCPTDRGRAYLRAVHL